MWKILLSDERWISVRGSQSPESFLAELHEYPEEFGSWLEGLSTHILTIYESKSELEDAQLPLNKSLELTFDCGLRLAAPSLTPPPNAA